MNCRECPMANAIASEGKVVLTCPALNGRPIGLMNTAKCELTWEDVKIGFSKNYIPKKLAAAEVAN